MTPAWLHDMTPAWGGPLGICGQAGRDAKWLCAGGLGSGPGGSGIGSGTGSGGSGRGGTGVSLRISFSCPPCARRKLRSPCRGRPTPALSVLTKQYAAELGQLVGAVLERGEFDSVVAATSDSQCSQFTRLDRAADRGHVTCRGVGGRPGCEQRPPHRGRRHTPTPRQIELARCTSTPGVLRLLVRRGAQIARGEFRTARSRRGRRRTRPRSGRPLCRGDKRGLLRTSPSA
jgi:hypothetical protein